MNDTHADLLYGIEYMDAMRHQTKCGVCKKTPPFTSKWETGHRGLAQCDNYAHLYSLCSKCFHEICGHSAIHVVRWIRLTPEQKEQVAKPTIKREFLPAHQLEVV